MERGAELTPKGIVSELDKYIVSQHEAKRCVAIALRNRWRRERLPSDIRDEVAPKNIIMVGPTGVGKTEIARRMAGLVSAPFIKVEASKYTEVGYHGRDVDSMVRDLVEVSINLVRAEEIAKVEKKAAETAEERMIDLLIPTASPESDASRPPEEETKSRRTEARERIKEKLRAGELDDRQVEITVEERSIPFMQVFSNAGIEEVGFDIPSSLGNMFPSKKQSKTMSVPKALKMLKAQESEKLIDRDKVVKEGLERAEEGGIIFIDEIDKIVGSEKTYGPDVSREGVQRDLLPIVEGSTVMTRYGGVKTDHVLFIAAGAFSVVKPSDLIPEFQGRFPLRVELKSLGKEDFVRILTEPKNALVKQYKALLETEGVKLEFRKDAISALAEIAAQANDAMQNIGARRLHTVLEKVLEEISFTAPDISPAKVVIDGAYVKEKLSAIMQSEDLKRYIL